MHKAQQHVNLHTNNGMGKRNVFYDDNGKELSVFVQANDDLFIEIKDIDGKLMNIALVKQDAILFILDLYRMKRLIVKE